MQPIPGNDNYMFATLSKRFLAKTFHSYKRLCEAPLRSDHYELCKLIDGPIKGVLLNQDNKTFIAHGDKCLYKIDQYGQLLDTLSIKGDLYSSGLCLAQEGYCDWMLSGDKSFKSYAPLEDARNMSDSTLFALLDQAQWLEFGDFRHEGNWIEVCYLYVNGTMRVLDISAEDERIDSHLDTPGSIYGAFHAMGWYQTALKGYTKLTSDSFKVVESSYYGNWGQRHKILKVQAFERDVYRFEEGFLGWLFGNLLGRTLLASLPGSPPESYWFGDGYFNLVHQGENLPFKAYVSKESGEVDFNNFVAYPLLDPTFPDIVLFSIKERLKSAIKHEDKFKRYYEQDIGLYIVRRRAE